MFQVIEKGDERKAVYSHGDLEYMLRRGWRKVATDYVAEHRIATSPVVERETGYVSDKPKRKYTRRAAR